LELGGSFSAQVLIDPSHAFQPFVSWLNPAPFKKWLKSPF